MDITAVDVHRALEARYGADSRVTDTALLGSGFEADIFTFTLHSDEQGARDLVLRLYAGDGAPEKAAHEFAAMERLYNAGFPVPQVFILSRDGGPLGRPYAIMDRVHGVSLGASYWGVAEDIRQRSQAVICRLMADLHALDGRLILPDSPLANSTDTFAAIDQELNHLAELLNGLQNTEPPSLRHAFDWLQARRASERCERLSVIHGDFHPNNVLVPPGGAPIVIDWSNIRLGDPRWDLAWLRVITRLEDEPSERATERQVYERLTGRTITGMDYFETVACMRVVLSVFSTLAFGATRLGMRPQAEARGRAYPEHTQSVVRLLQKRTGIPMADLDDRFAELFRQGGG